MNKVYLRTGADDIYFSKPKTKKSKTICYTVKKEIVLASLTLGNATLMITNNCPKDFADCAIRAFCGRGAVLDDDYDYAKPYIPRYSKFIGQLGGKSR